MKKELNLNTKEIRKKKIQRLRKLISFGETFLIVIPILCFGIVLIFTAISILSGENTLLNSELNNMFGIEEIIITDRQEEIKIMLESIVSFIGYIINILIIDKIRKIFENVEREETPFTEKNIELLKKIKKLVLISFISLFLGNEYGISIIPVIIVLALVEIFKHGCELQKEVDETL